MDANSQLKAGQHLLQFAMKFHRNVLNRRHCFHDIVQHNMVVSLQDFPNPPFEFAELKEHVTFRVALNLNVNLVCVPVGSPAFGVTRDEVT